MSPARPSASAVEQPLLDKALLGELFEGLGHDDLAPLLDGMAAEVTTKLGLLGESVDQGKDGAARLAHSLKGLAAQFGAARLSAAAAQIERAAKEDKDIRAMVAGLGPMAEETLVALREWRDRASP